MNDLRPWIKGAFASALHFAGVGLVAVIIDPAKFNPAQGGFKHLLTVAGVSALFGLGTYLAQSPLSKD